MTLIIGIRSKDGVVLGSERKILRGVRSGIPIKFSSLIMLLWLLKG